MSKDERIAHLQKCLKNSNLRRFREVKRAERKTLVEDETKFWVDILGDRVEDRLQLYSFEHVSFVILIGTCPSPGGARSPLSRVGSHLSLEVVYKCVQYQLCL